MGDPKKRTRRFRSKQEITDLLELFGKSGKSPTAFCREHQLSYGTFTKWLKKSEMKASNKVQSDFVQLAFNPGVPVLEIIYPNGCRINFYSQADIVVLKSLLN